MLTKNNLRHSYTRSIYIPGFYALTCVSNSEYVPDVTIFRRDSASILKGGRSSLVAKFAATGKFSFFALRHAKSLVDHFEVRDGRVYPLIDPVEIRPSFITEDDTDTDFGDFTADLGWLIANPTVCATFAAKTGFAAASRSNFYSVLDLMVNRSEDVNDLEHTYVLTKSGDVVRSVVVVDLVKTTDAVRDVFLDHFGRLKANRPLNKWHHITEMGRTLASCHYPRLMDMLLEARTLCQSDAEDEQYKMVLASLPMEVRMGAAVALLEVVYDDLLLEDTGHVEFPTDVVNRHHKEIDYKVGALLTLPFSYN